MKPTIDTDCMAAVGDGDTVRTALLSWPACGPAHGGAVLQLSSTVLPTGQQVGLLDVHVDRARYRDGAQLLVRCAPAQMQVPGLPLGTTLERPAQELVERLQRLQQVALRALALLDTSAIECAAERGDLTDHGVPDYSALQHLRQQLQAALEVEHG